jgi:hypothetical protein
MPGDLDDFYVHTVSVETKTGSVAYGDVYASAVSVPCWAEPKRRLVRTRDGQEVLSSSFLSCDVEHAPKFTPDSKVTLNGATAYVIGVNTFTSGALELPDHLEIDLT